MKYSDRLYIGFAHADASTVNVYGHEPSLTVIVYNSAEGTWNVIVAPAANEPTSTRFPDAFAIV